MVSIRRRRLLGFSTGICPFMVELPKCSDNRNDSENAIHNTRLVNVHQMPLEDVNQLKEINVSISGSSKEDQHQQFSVPAHYNSKAVKVQASERLDADEDRAVQSKKQETEPLQSTLKAPPLAPKGVLNVHLPPFEKKKASIDVAKSTHDDVILTKRKQDLADDVVSKKRRMEDIYIPPWKLSVYDQVTSDPNKAMDWALNVRMPADCKILNSVPGEELINSSVKVIADVFHGQMEALLRIKRLSVRSKRCEEEVVAKDKEIGRLREDSSKFKKLIAELEASSLRVGKLEEEVTRLQGALSEANAKIDDLVKGKDALQDMRIPSKLEHLSLNVWKACIRKYLNSKPFGNLLVNFNVMAYREGQNEVWRSLLKQNPQFKTEPHHDVCHVEVFEELNLGVPEWALQKSDLPPMNPNIEGYLSDSPPATPELEEVDENADPELVEDPVPEQ